MASDIRESGQQHLQPHLHSIHQLLGAPLHFVAVSLLEPVPLICEISVDGLVARGFQVHAQACASRSVGKQIEASRIKSRRPIALVLPDGLHAPTVLSAAHDILKWAAASSHSIELLTLQDGRLHLNGSPVPPAIAPSPLNANVVVGGRNDLTFGARDLPFRLRFSSPLENRPGNSNLTDGSKDGFAIHSTIRITGIGEDAGRLPAEAWFHLGGLPGGELTIDVEAGVDAAQWKLTHTNGRSAPIAAPTLPSGGDDAVVLRRLVLIVDRTCPDESNWAAAADLVIRRAPREEDSYLFKDSAALPAKDMGWQDFNKGIREELGDSINSFFGSTGVRIDAFWFGDRPYNSLTAPPAIYMPDVEAGSYGTFTPVQVCDGLRNATYVPGLDVWDPLDKAMDIALTQLTDGRPLPSAILIVGNSPPTLPAQNDSPFREVLNRLFTHRTNYRSMTAGWHDSLVQCEELGIPVVYLFLTHQDPGKQENINMHNVFSHMQAKIASAFEACGIVVVRRPARRGQIANGISECVPYLRPVMPSRSWVYLESVSTSGRI